jgi:hypothetical protein
VLDSAKNKSTIKQYVMNRRKQTMKMITAQMDSTSYLQIGLDGRKDLGFAKQEHVSSLGGRKHLGKQSH